MKEELKEIIQKSINDLDIIFDGQINVEVPNDKNNGDYSSNIAMQLSKIMKDNPMKIAEKIVEMIKSSKITKIEVKTPGFINFFVGKEYLLNYINEVIEKNKEYGASSIGKKQKINVEFVSANPTGLLHVGTARGAAYGDSLCRILKFTGFDVTREYYFNDGGVQIEKLGKSLFCRYQEKCGLKVSFPEDGYHGGEIIDIAESLYTDNKDKLLNETPAFFEEYAKNKLMEIIKKDLDDFRVTFDVWTSEQTFRDSGNIEKCLKVLADGDNIYESAGATWLKSTKYGDDKDRVLIKSDGNYTYLVPDIAYHLDKINRGFDQLINVLGSDHHSYVNRLKASVIALGYNADKIKIKMLQMVHLHSDGQEIKMSKRTGQTVTMRELMEEVGINAARYFFAARNLDSQMDFDLNLAKKTSNENPVYYVCYAYARISSILNENKSIAYVEKYVTIKNEEAYNVLEKVAQFPEVVENAALKELPHLITNYVYELSALFHLFYTKNRIITENEEETNENLAFIQCVRITLANALNLIGVIPPERM